MDVTPENLRSIFVSLSTLFNRRLTTTPTQYTRVAMDVSSTAAQNEYPKLEDMPGLREWIGDRVIHDLSGSTYAIKNKEFEGTIGVDRAKIEDDQIGFYGPISEQLGLNTAEFPDQLTFGLLKKGNQVLCSDGQYFFDTDHPGFDENGGAIVVSNYQDGAGPAWFLIDDTQVLKPLVFQKRRSFALTSLDKPDDGNVFHKKKFIYGVDGRCNVGFGMWQLAFMSRAELNPTNYALARAAMTSIRRRDGNILNIRPRLLMFPGVLEAQARALLAANNAAGATNIWANTVEPLLVPGLG
ncbi:Mu-like prophage major head subunit gpT family protein [Xanthobacter sp. DSM 24535]|uniref:Mu-like prophage major head subunit gpT family protein n=1 Tax=Roseixanthobacter psychrophilus TaxID=3119917 RepID=UPI003726B6EE